METDRPTDVTRRCDMCQRKIDSDRRRRLKWRERAGFQGKASFDPGTS